MLPFQITIDVLGDCATIRLAGDLDVAIAPSLRDHVVLLVSEGRSHLVFDCSKLDFVDSTGLGVLIGARARCIAANGIVELTGVRPALQRLLAVTGIEGLFREQSVA